METRTIIPLKRALYRAMRYGFRSRFIERTNRIHSLLTNRSYSEQEFAIIKSHPVSISDEKEATLCYIVLNNGELGFLIKDTNKKETDEILNTNS